MPLKNCRECGKPAATSAKACPMCGAPNPTGKRTSLGTIVVGFFLLFALYLWVGFLLEPSDSTPGPESATSRITALSGEHRYVHQATNVRAGPGTDQVVVRQLPPGERVKVHESQGSWARIGRGQWVHISLLTTEPLVRLHRGFLDSNVIIRAGYDDIDMTVRHYLHMLASVRFPDGGSIECRGWGKQGTEYVLSTEWEGPMDFRFTHDPDDQYAGAYSWLRIREQGATISASEALGLSRAISSVFYAAILDPDVPDSVPAFQDNWSHPCWTAGAL
jgi:hypothetical protein